MTDKILVVCVNSGRYPKSHLGYETLNLEPNADGMFYGYVPPDDNVDIRRLEPSANNVVTGVLLIYVEARRIIAYSKNATVFSDSKPGENKGRKFIDLDGSEKWAPYSVQSDNLVDLRSTEYQFIIEPQKYGSKTKVRNMFRKQRSYLDAPELAELKHQILNYISSLENDDIMDADYQYDVQESDPKAKADTDEIDTSPDDILITNGGLQMVKRNPAIAKRVLEDSSYLCSVDHSHTTFVGRSGKPYMEAHHLIPCTVLNSERFRGISKLDRKENIICICPNCHRALHFGNATLQEDLLKKLFSTRKSQLLNVGLDLSLEELISTYRKG